MTSKLGRRLFSASLLAPLAALAAMAAGCGGPETNPVELVRVGGVVTLDDQPLEKAIVVFESADASFAHAETDSDGRFDLRFDSSSRGVTPGRKTVRISMNRRIHGLNSFDEGSPDDQAGGSFEAQPPERIPERYNIRSELTANVTPDTDTFDFELTTKEPRR